MKVKLRMYDKCKYDNDKKEIVVDWRKLINIQEDKELI